MENLTESSLEELYEVVAIRNKYGRKYITISMFDINMLIEHIRDLEEEINGNCNR